MNIQSICAEDSNRMPPTHTHEAVGINSDGLGFFLNQPLELDE